ncbi:MAG: alpha/beta hydrolase [SAR86 cluster bacterium]|uniref:Alpha/beta hydrolase n=1 Tax=SAR86 cluster bacterium TaxID=2030880 RepID=A0A2A4MEA1_9GAMM|nr:MAG: alpha/beta hydrolase [SAR86 cluster bacterium]
MNRLQRSLEQADYRVVNMRYPSTKFPIAELAQKAVSESLQQCHLSNFLKSPRAVPPQGQVHFVTHSLGGILVRQYLSTSPMASLGRVVMLGPPNKGSELIDTLSGLPGFNTFNGPAGAELGTGELSVPNSLGPANFELGIIAGTQSMNFILSSFLPKPNDGKVSVESTKIEGMNDHISLPVTHTFMMNNSQVIEQVMIFLRQGEFQRP